MGTAVVVEAKIVMVLEDRAAAQDGAEGGSTEAGVEEVVGAVGAVGVIFNITGRQVLF